MSWEAEENRRWDKMPMSRKSWLFTLALFFVLLLPFAILIALIRRIRGTI